MKKIVIIGSTYPLRGGLASYNERLAREFQNQGHEVIIYTFSLQYPNFLFPGKTQYSESLPPNDLDIRVKINSINPFNWIKYGRQIRKLKPDIVLIKFWLPFMGPCFGSLARLIKKNKVSKIISILDNIIPHEKRMGDRLLANYFVKAVDGFVSQSKSVEIDLKKFDTVKPRIFNPHPIFDNFGPIIPKKTARNQLELNENGNYILFFGFIREYKGLDLLLEALADPIMDTIGVKLIIAGEYYNDPGPYEKIIKDKKLSGKIIQYNHFIKDEEVGKYFCASDLVVQPYKNATQSGVTQIGYHFNKPMIVTRIGGLPEIIPDNKVGYVVSLDPGSIAKAIVKFYQEDKEKLFSENAAQEKKKYSWESMASKILGLSEIIGKN